MLQRLNVWVIYVLLWGLYVHYNSSEVEHLCAMWQLYLFSNTCQKCVHCTLSHGWLQQFFMCHIYIHIHLSYKPIKYLVNIACMSNLVGIFVSRTYLEITWKVLCIAVGFVLAHMYKNVSSICPFSVLAVWHTFTLWQSYLFSDICQICAQRHWE